MAEHQQIKECPSPQESLPLMCNPGVIAPVCLDAEQNGCFESICVCGRRKGDLRLRGFQLEDGHAQTP